jgi:outer membrane receptor protein involved in Fe transport
MFIRKTAVASAVAGALLAPLASPTHAQQAAAADDVLDEIIVTARRREENLQTVPLAITAFSGESLEARGVDMVGNMNAMAPNLSVQGQAGRTNESEAAFRVRGVPGVAVYVDGIDQTSAIGLFTMGVVEVERIEVLRGPQGTLFGNSALGGAVHYVTRRPADEFSARVNVRTGTLDRLDIQGSVDVPFTEKFLTKFTFADMSTEGFMQSVDSGIKYGDINDQFYRADLLFQPTDNLDIRYSYDRSEQDRQGGSRAVWEIGPKNIFTLPNGVVFNTNPHAQAYENAFGILFDDHNVSSGHPGGIIGEYETRVADDTNGLQLTMDRQTLDVTWDINDALTFRALAGDRVQTRRVMVQFDADSRVFLSDRQDNDEIDEQSYELQLLGSYGERDQFSFVFGYYNSERTTKARFPTFHGVPFICDLLGQPAAPGQAPSTADRRGVTIADRAECFNNRMRAINQQANFVATPQMTAAQIQAMWTGIVGNPAANTLYNYNGVTPGILAGLNGPNFDALDITDLETEAFFADFSWAITERLTLAVGARQQEDTNFGTAQIRGTNFTEFSRWDDIQVDYRDPFGYTAVSNKLPVAVFEDTTARASLQYQWTDDLMTYITVSNGYAPGSVSQVPSNILVLNAQGVATNPNPAAPPPLLTDIYNANPSLVDLPYRLERGKETVDNYEIGMKADWADGRIRTNLTAFMTDWQNMAGSTYVATVWWDLNGNGAAEVPGAPGYPNGGFVPCAARCDTTNTSEVNYFPNLLTAGVLKAEASGIELEVTYLGGENFQLGFNTGLLDTEFVELGQAGEGTVPAYDEGDGFPGAPDMTANLWGQYDFMLSNNRSFSARLDYTWTDDYTTFAGGPLQRTQEAFGLLNARLVYDSGSNWSIALAGTNLTDEYYSPAFFYTVSQQLWDGSVGRPREAYIAFDFSFE